MHRACHPAVKAESILRCGIGLISPGTNALPGGTVLPPADLPSPRLRRMCLTSANRVDPAGNLTGQRQVPVVQGRPRHPLGRVTEAEAFPLETDIDAEKPVLPRPEDRPLRRASLPQPRPTLHRPHPRRNADMEAGPHCRPLALRRPRHPSQTSSPGRRPPRDHGRPRLGPHPGRRHQHPHRPRLVRPRQPRRLRRPPPRHRTRHRLRGPPAPSTPS